MTSEDAPPNEAELREAELLASALENPGAEGRDVTAVDDALGAAWMVRASRRGDLDDLRARAVQERAWPKRPWRTRGRAGAAAVAAAAATIAIFAARSHGPAQLPAPGARLLLAQLAAARPGSGSALARFEADRAAYREQVFGALRRAYGGRR
jgi:hypothetical protein